MRAGIRVLGGAGTIGGNKVHVQWEGASVMLDFGLDYSRSGEFYGDMLRPRDNRGVGDPLRLGLLPPIADYRRDLVPGDVDLSSFPRLELDAVMVTHPHLDHCGHVGFLDAGVPLVSSGQCAATIKAMMDCRADITRSAVYHAERREEEGLLVSSRSYRGRDRLMVDGCPGELEAFLGCSLKRKGIEGGAMLGREDLPFTFDAHPVDHSVHGAMGFTLHSPVGGIVYTGDVRTHGRKGRMTWEFAERVSSEARVLIIEGTRIDDGSRVSEEEVALRCRECLEGEQGLVVADFPSRDIERLETFRELADSMGRRLVITPREAYMLDALMAADGVDRSEGCLVFRPSKERKGGVEKLMDERHGDSMVSIEEISAEPSAHVLCFSQYELPNLLDGRLSGGCYVYSSTEAFDPEGEMDLLRLYNWITALGLRPVGLSMEGYKAVSEPGFHASGHASREDLLRLIEVIDPEYVVPVHTRRPDLFRELVDDRKVILPRPGTAMDLEL